jgi:hypothetical protein
MLRFAVLPALVAAFGANSSPKSERRLSLGGFNLPSIPIPLPTALPTLPTDFIKEIPSVDFRSIVPEPLKSYISELPSNPFGGIDFNNRTSQLPIPSFPDFPSVPALPSIPELPSVPELPSELTDFVRSIEPAIKSLVGTALPTIRGPPLPTLNIENLKNVYEDAANAWRTNHTFKVPESDDELRDLLANKTRFDLAAADAYLDRLGDATGTDVHGSLRLIAGLVLNNQSFGSLYERTTREFTASMTRVREGAAAYNFSDGLRVLLPALGLQNQSLNVVRYVRNPYEALSAAPINSSVVGIMLGDLTTGNETEVRDLATLLNFTIPVNATGSEQLGASCVYWTGGDWSDAGCHVLELLEDSVLCGCNHLTDFAVILSAAAPTTTTPKSILIVAATAEEITPTPNGLSSVAIGLASGGSLLGAILIVAAIMNIRHNQQNKKMRPVVKYAPMWAYPTNNLAHITVEP